MTLLSKAKSVPKEKGGFYGEFVMEITILLRPGGQSVAATQRIG